MKMKTMIMIAAICFAIIPMIVFATVTNILVRNDGKKMFESELKSMAAAQSSSMQSILNKVHADAETLKELPGVKDYGQTGSFAVYSQSVADDNVNRFIGDNPLINSASVVDSG